MKKYLQSISTLTLLLLSAGSLCAQSIPNSSFETWVPIGPFQNPTGWSGPPSVSKSTNAHSGSFAMQLKTGIFTNPQTSVTDTFPGTVYSGQQGSGPGMPGIMGFPYTARPDSIVGWFNYAPVGSDNFHVLVSLTKRSAGTNSQVAIAAAGYTGNASASYKRFSISLNYYSSLSPDTANIIILSSNVGPPSLQVIGSALVVDDLAFVVNSPTGIRSLKLVNEDALVFPNPADQSIHLSHLKASCISLVNAMGQELARYPTQNSESMTIDVSQFAPGLYFIFVDSKYLQKQIIEH